MGAARGAARRPRRPRRRSGRCSPSAVELSSAMRTKDSTAVALEVGEGQAAAVAELLASRLRRDEIAPRPGRDRAGGGGGAIEPAARRRPRSSRSSATAPTPPARRWSAASPAAASRSSPPTGSTASPAIRSTPAAIARIHGSRAATTASPRRSCTSRRWRCGSWSRGSARAPRPRSAPCCPGR